MKALDSSFAFLHTLELGARDSSDFCTRGTHVVGKHHNMVDANNVQNEGSVATTRKWLCGNSAATEWCGSFGPVVVMDHRQPRNACNRTGATYEREMVHPWRQRLVNVQRHVTE
jgi:hypothetical protein